jgi:hypothetical protein
VVGSWVISSNAFPNSLFFFLRHIFPFLCFLVHKRKKLSSLSWLDTNTFLGQPCLQALAIGKTEHPIIPKQKQKKEDREIERKSKERS